MLKKYELKIIRVPTEPLHKSFAINFPQAYVVFGGAAYISARKIKIQTMYHKQNIANVFGGKPKVKTYDKLLEGFGELLFHAPIGARVYLILLNLFHGYYKGLWGHKPY